MSEENTNGKIELFRVDPAGVKPSRRPFVRMNTRRPERAPDLAVCWKMIRRRQWTVLTAFVVMLGTILIATLAEKPVYRAKKLLEIDRENPGLVNTQELLQLDEVSDAYLETQYKVLGSDDLARRVIEQLGLSKVPEFQPNAGFWPWAQPAGSPSRANQASGAAPVSAAAEREVVLANFQKVRDQLVEIQARDRLLQDSEEQLKVLIETSSAAILTRRGGSR